MVVLPRSVAKCNGHRPIVFSWSTNRVRPCADTLPHQNQGCFEDGEASGQQSQKSVASARLPLIIVVSPTMCSGQVAILSLLSDARACPRQLAYKSLSCMQLARLKAQ